MSADIEKLAVFDSRIVQSRPKYAVEKGALSLTNAPFNAIAASASQHTYNIYVPSENVFVDRAIEWSSTVYQTVSVSFASSGVAQPGVPIAVPGRDFALQSFPLNSLCSTLTATINDTTSVINSQDVLKEVLRLTDYKKNRSQRTCPTMLDKYQSYDDAFGAVNNPLSGFENQTDYAETPNGAFYNLVFTDPSGTTVLGSGTGFTTAGSPAYPGAPYTQINGVPVVAPAWSATATYAAGALVVSAGAVWSAVVPVVGTAPAAPAWSLVLASATGPYPLYLRWRSTEKVVLSPFVFADCHEWDTGLFGINNIQLIMNLREPSRSIRATARTGRLISPAAYNSFAASPYSDSVVNVMFLTPSLDVPLPPKSVVPYMEFPRYITQNQNGTVAPGAVVQLQSQTITLPQIPDLFIIYVKPSRGTGAGGAFAPTDADYYLPLATAADGIRNPINVNFDNFSGLLSSTTAEQLYAMSIKNGLEMDWNQWVGQAHSSAANSEGAFQLPGGRIPLTGGLLVLKPSQDITLQTGQAPSLVGNFTFQFNLQVKNTSSVAQQPQLYVITANSGFFESIRGSSRIIKGVLSEQDIISAPLAPMATRDSLSRYVGAGMFSSLANVLSKVKDVYERTKPIVSAVKGALPDSGMMGKVKGALGHVGYGTGGDASGGMKGRLSARLM